MHPHNLSTRSFKFSLLHVDKRTRQAVLTGAWVLFFLVLLDISINLLFPYPTNPLISSTGALNTYFEYGRSIEGKLTRLVGPTNESSSPLAQAGWLDPEKWEQENLPTQRKPSEDLLIAIYGQSFAFNVGQAMHEIDHKLGFRMIGGPAAPPNYAFAAYHLDRGHHDADVVILGLLASSVKALRTLNGTTWQFEGPAPYTYPRYFLEAGELKAVSPQILTLAELRIAMKDRQKWHEYVTQLQEYDDYFHPFLFNQNLLDHSAIIRMLRRAWGQRHTMAVSQQSHTPDGFNQAVEVPLLRAIVTDFARTARHDGKLPIVLLFNDLGYQDHLFQALKPTLAEHAIPYMSTHTIAPTTDPKNFVSDGHFTESVNKPFAQVVLALINQNFPQR